MLNTFDALAKFPDEKTETSDNQQNDTTAVVDMSAIINRLNEMETKINELVNKSTDIPTRGNNDGDNKTTDDNATDINDTDGADRGIKQ